MLNLLFPIILAAYPAGIDPEPSCYCQAIKEVCPCIGDKEDESTALEDAPKLLQQWQYIPEETGSVLMGY